MKELSRQRFTEAASCLAIFECHVPIWSSVLEGNAAGHVFTDDAEEPRAWLLHMPGIWSYIAGDPGKAEFIRDATDYLFKDMSPDMGEVVIFSSNEAWRSELDAALARRGAIRILRKTFRFEPGRFASYKAGRRISADAAVEHIEDDDRKNFGVRVMKDGLQVSECRSVFVGGGQAEVMVHTEEAHRGKGYATIAAAAFVDACQRRGLVPNWGCWPYNVASERLAERLGFEAAQDLPAHFWTPGM